jgi:hypothetical protein
MAVAALKQNSSLPRYRDCHEHGAMGELRPRKKHASRFLPAPVIGARLATVQNIEVERVED